MAAAQSHQLRDRRRGAGCGLSGGAVCAGEAIRSTPAHERRPHRKGEVRSMSVFSKDFVSHDCSLRRRFEQNQEDCTFTVLAILPTATENLLDAIPVEQVLEELQKQKAERLSRSVGPSEIASTAPPSVADTAEDDAKSSSLQSDSFIHASQIAGEAASATGSAEGGAESTERKNKKSKAQLWNEMKISCKCNQPHKVHIDSRGQL